MLAELIEKYVQNLKDKGVIKSPLVERAFRRVPRHKLLEAFYDLQQKCFLEVDPQNPTEEVLKTIYSDSPLVTRMVGEMPTSSTSQPSLVALMLELLELGPGQRVLEIGAGTGYNAALIWEIVGEEGQVTTIDIQEDVVAQTRRLLRASGYDKIEVIAGDGFYGYPKNAPYDRIVATVGCPDISPHWVEQLAPSGFMLIPLQHGAEGHDPLVRVRVEENRIKGEFVGVSGFMGIQGELADAITLRFPEQKKIFELEPKERPLPATLSTWSSLNLQEQCNFVLFLSVVTGRAGWGKPGATVFAPGRGACAVTQDKILLFGEAEELCTELEEWAKRWHTWGKPGPERWELEFRWKDEFLPAEDELTWLIPRKYTVEIARLKAPYHNADLNKKG